MFGKKTNQPSPQLESSAQPSTKPELWGEIYTMPNNYRAATPARSSGKGPLVVSLVLLLVVILGLVSYLFLRSDEKEAETPSPPSQSSVVDPSPSPTPPLELVTASERDRVRFRDIREIQAALELYFAESNQYPLAPLSMVLGTSSSNVLSAAGFSGSPQGVVYLVKVPQNSEPGGSPYLYESLDGSSYSLRFRLEQGTAGLDSGDHMATPLGIDEKAPVAEPPRTPRTPTPPPPTTDADSDGLTDAEEDIFGTDIDKPDTDSDGYTDGSEVESDYDPVLEEGALLLDSPKLQNYENNQFYYQLMHPAEWEVEKIDQDGSEIIIAGGGSEFMGILIVDNTDKLTAKEWYAKQFPSLQSSEVPEFKAGEITWAMAPDGLNVYLATENNIITFSYNIGTAERASYYQLFKTMIRSFKLMPPVQPLLVPIETSTTQETGEQ